MQHEKRIDKLESKMIKNEIIIIYPGDRIPESGQFIILDEQDRNV